VDEDLRLLSCRHVFHKDRVDRWLETGRNNCPTCRTQVRVFISLNPQASLIDSLLSGRIHHGTDPHSIGYVVDKADECLNPLSHEQFFGPGLMFAISFRAKWTLFWVFFVVLIMPLLPSCVRLFKVSFGKKINFGCFLQHPFLIVQCSSSTLLALIVPLLPLLPSFSSPKFS
jgi:hypothetical protein